MFWNILAIVLILVLILVAYLIKVREPNNTNTQQHPNNKHTSIMNQDQNPFITTSTHTEGDKTFYTAHIKPNRDPQDAGLTSNPGRIKKRVRLDHGTCDLDANPPYVKKNDVYDEKIDFTRNEGENRDDFVTCAQDLLSKDLNPFIITFADTKGHKTVYTTFIKPNRAQDTRWTKNSGQIKQWVRLDDGTYEQVLEANTLYAKKQDGYYVKIGFPRKEGETLEAFTTRAQDLLFRDLNPFIITSTYTQGDKTSDTAYIKPNRNLLDPAWADNHQGTIKKWVRLDHGTFEQVLDANTLYGKKDDGFYAKICFFPRNEGETSSDFITRATTHLLASHVRGVG